jgi:elongation factor P
MALPPTGESGILIGCYRFPNTQETIPVIAATQIKVGMVIVHDGKPCRVTNVLHVTPGNWRGMVHAKMVNLITGSQVEHRFRSEDKVERAELDHHPLQYLYRSGEEFTFMNTENYEMYNVSAENLGDAVNYLMDGMTVEMSYYEGKPVAVDLPMFVELEIVETDPVMRGATISSSPKTAKLNTGLVTKVPQHMSIGDRVKIDTRDGSFVERV